MESYDTINVYIVNLVKHRVFYIYWIIYRSDVAKIKSSKKIDFNTHNRHTPHTKKREQEREGSLKVTIVNTMMCVR